MASPAREFWICSRYIRAEDQIKISFVPEANRDALERWLVEKSQHDGGKRLLSVLADLPRFLPPGLQLSVRLTKRLLQISGIDFELQMSQLTRVMRNRLIDNLTGFIYGSILCLRL